MTYNVFGGTLNLCSTQLLCVFWSVCCAVCMRIKLYISLERAIVGGVFYYTVMVLVFFS